MKNQEEKAYLLALCEGRREGISAIYRNHAQHVQTWVLQNNGDVADAKDLFQEALMAIYDRYCGTDFELTSPFGALLFSICRKQWYGRLRQKKREDVVRNTTAEQYKDETVEGDLLVLAEEAIAESEKQACMQRTFELLSKQCQSILSLLAKGRSGTEIAERLQLPNANAVYQAKHRCASRWRQLFEDQCKA